LIIYDDVVVALLAERLPAVVFVAAAVVTVGVAVVKAKR
jgi:hypothetical protein